MSFEEEFPELVEEVDGNMLGCEAVEKYCLSKQKVREAIDETMKEAIEYYPSFHKHINGALKEVMKRLGL